MPSIINRISGFWSKKSDNQNINHIKEPILNSDTIEKPILNSDTIEDPLLKQPQSRENNDISENNENFKDLSIDLDEQEDKVLEIPAFLRRQVN